MASIERVSRGREGTLSGFQRQQIASHISEIRDYLSGADAVLPNAIVVAFVDGVKVTDRDAQVVELSVDVSEGPVGSIVDGQQRISALAGLQRRDFEVFVSALICDDYEELRKQFVLINNTRPLPKALIYELLPSVDGLPARLSSRSFAATLTERLNFDPASSLRGQILQHTNPEGVVRDTAIQKVIMNSMADGALREMGVDASNSDPAFRLISEFFAAVQEVFRSEWYGHTPRTSRLVHGAGIVAMGYVMEALYTRVGACRTNEFSEGLRSLVGRTAWTQGTWVFGPDDRRTWNSLQNVPRDIMQLAHYLVSVIKRPMAA